MGDEKLHQRHVAYRVLSGHDDLIELHVFAYRGSRLELICPQLPPAWALKRKVKKRLRAAFEIRKATVLPLKQGDT